MKPTGYLVMESCEDYEQALCLRTNAEYPPGGILDWTDSNAIAMFASREDARKAKDRTEHYRMAFGRTNLPEKKLCRIAPIRAVTPNAKSQATDAALSRQVACTDGLGLIGSERTTA